MLQRLTRRLLAFSGLLMLSAAPVSAQTPTATITALSPDSPTLAPRQALYARVEYDSPVPFRLQAQGWLGGEKVQAAMMNPSPVYPAGQGEAIAWMALDAGGRIDEIHVTISDARWKSVAEISHPVSAEWAAGRRANTDAPWVAQLNAVQQRSVGEAMESSYSSGSALISLLLPVMFFLVPAYPILQIVALVRLVGTPRKVAIIPLFVMIPVYAFCLFALLQDSNLWPLFAIFTSMPAALVVMAALFLGRRGATA